MMTFELFFQAATGYAPYDYQRRLAGGGADLCDDERASARNHAIL